jgi:hypothetical protein
MLKTKLELYQVTKKEILNEFGLNTNNACIEYLEILPDVRWSIIKDNFLHIDGVVVFTIIYTATLKDGFLMVSGSSEGYGGLDGVFILTAENGGFRDCFMMPKILDSKKE